MKFVLMGLVLVLGVCIGIAKGTAQKSDHGVKTKISTKE